MSESTSIVEMATRIVTAHVSRTSVESAELGKIIKDVIEALSSSSPPGGSVSAPVPSPASRPQAAALFADAHETKVEHASGSAEEQPAAPAEMFHAHAATASEASPGATPIPAAEAASLSVPLPPDVAQEGGMRGVGHERIICLEDGKSVVFLRRHLNQLGISPADYIAKWSLSPDYPLVAPIYTEAQRKRAISQGLGRSNGVRPGPPLERKPRRKGTLKPVYGR